MSFKYPYQIFANSDDAENALVDMLTTDPIEPLTVLMVDVDTGKYKVWDAAEPATAAAVLSEKYEGVGRGSIWKSGTFFKDVLIWPAGIDEGLKQNAFGATQVSVF